MMITSQRAVTPELGYRRRLVGDWFEVKDDEEDAVVEIPRRFDTIVVILHDTGIPSGGFLKVTYRRLFKSMITPESGCWYMSQKFSSRAAVNDGFYPRAHPMSPFSEMFITAEANGSTATFTLFGRKCREHCTVSGGSDKTTVALCQKG